MKKIEFLTPKTERFLHGWSRLVSVDGVRYSVTVTKGKMVRIPYKPRGRNIGYKWDGAVFNADTGKRLWDGDVPGSIGVRGLLKAAGVIETTLVNGRWVEKEEGE